MRRFFSWARIVLIALVAYMLGAKIGRGGYRDTKTSATSVWNDPKLKKARKPATKKAHNAARTVKNRATKVGL